MFDSRIKKPNQTKFRTQIADVAFTAATKETYILKRKLLRSSTRNSSGDEIANVNFLYHIVHVLPLAIRHLANNNHTTALAAVQCARNERAVPHFNALARRDPLPISP